MSAREFGWLALAGIVWERMQNGRGRTSVSNVGIEVGRTGFASLLFTLARPADATASALGDGTLRLKLPIGAREIAIGEIERIELQTRRRWGGVLIRTPAGALGSVRSVPTRCESPRGGARGSTNEVVAGGAVGRTCRSPGGGGPTAVALGSRGLRAVRRRPRTSATPTSTWLGDPPRGETTG